MTLEQRQIKQAREFVHQKLSNSLDYHQGLAEEYGRDYVGVSPHGDLPTYGQIVDALREALLTLRGY